MMTDSGMRMNTQTKLSAEQIAAFYHDEFVEDQVRDFRALIDGDRADKVIVDIGGGCGFFARRLRDVAGERTRVVDMDSRSIEECARLGVEGQIGDRSEEHTSELQSLMRSSYADFCVKKK